MLHIICLRFISYPRLTF